MAFKRYDGFYSKSLQEKFDGEMATCPFCGDNPHWLLDLKSGLTKGTVTCMCEKCSAKLYTEGSTSGWNDNLRVVDVGNRNINNLALNGTYHITMLGNISTRLAVRESDVFDASQNVPTSTFSSYTDTPTADFQNAPQPTPITPKSNNTAKSLLKNKWVWLASVAMVILIVMFAILFGARGCNSFEDNVPKTVSVSEIPSEWEYFIPSFKFNKKDGEDFYWNQIGFAQVSFHIEVGSQKINPKLKYIDSYGETKITNYKSDADITTIAVESYTETPYGGYNIESMEFDNYNYDACNIYSTQSIKDVTSDSFSVVIEKIEIIYVDGTKEISKDYTGSQISENFDLEINLIGYDFNSNNKIYKLPNINNVILEINDVEVSFRDYGIYISWKLTSNLVGRFNSLTVRFADNTKIEQRDYFDFSISDNDIIGTSIRGDFSRENLLVEIKFSILLTNGTLVFSDTVVVTDFEIVNNI